MRAHRVVLERRVGEHDEAAEGQGDGQHLAQRQRLRGEDAQPLQHQHACERKGSRTSAELAEVSPPTDPTNLLMGFQTCSANACLGCCCARGAENQGSSSGTVTLSKRAGRNFSHPLLGSDILPHLPWSGAPGSTLHPVPSGVAPPSTSLGILNPWWSGLLHVPWLLYLPLTCRYPSQPQWPLVPSHLLRLWVHLTWRAVLPWAPPTRRPTPWGCTTAFEAPVDPVCGSTSPGGGVSLGVHHSLPPPPGARD